MVKLKGLNPALLPLPQVTLKGEKMLFLTHSHKNNSTVKWPNRQAIFTGNVTPLFNSVLQIDEERDDSQLKLLFST